MFLHANGFNALTYRHVLARLGGEARVLAIDLRGHGLTTLPAPEGGVPWQVYADDLVALLEATGDMPRVLAGHSMGGTTIVLALPGLPRAALPRVVLFDPVLPPRAAFADPARQPAWAFPLARGALRRRAVFASRDEAYAQFAGRGAFATWPGAMLHDYLEDGLLPADDGTLTLACRPGWEAANFAHYCMSDPYPTLDARLADMRIFKAAEASTCFLELNDPRVEVVSETTHFIPMERPDLVRQAVAAAFD